MRPFFRFVPFFILASLTITACGLLPSPGFATPTPGRTTLPQTTATRAPLPALSPSRSASSPSPTVIAPNAEIDNVTRLQKSGELKIINPVHLIWSPDGKSLGVVTQSGFSIFNAQTLQNNRTVAINQPTVLLDLSPDLRVYTTTSDQQILELRDTSNGSLLRTIKPGGAIGDAVFAPDSKTFATTSLDEIAVTLWDVQSGQQIKKWTGFQTAAPVYSVAFSGDGKTLLWISRGSIQLMDISNGKLGARFQHEDFIFDEALTPDGRTLITVAEGTAIFWDIATLKKSKVTPPLEPLSLSLSPSGRVLALTHEKEIVLMDVANQKQLRTLTGHTDRVSRVAFSADGLMLASSSDDDTVKVWAVK